MSTAVLMNPVPLASERRTQMEQKCFELREAIDNGTMGDIVAKHEALILQYYQDVQEQAKQSFGTARYAARIGFWVVIGALAYALGFDALSRLGFHVGAATEGSMTISKLGLVSGALIEFVAGVAFWLYSRGAKQFSAFHICLERTHRYLLAYSIANQITGEKDEALRRIACIMANAPMITRMDVESLPSANTVVPSVPAPLVS